MNSEKIFSQNLREWSLTRNFIQFGNYIILGFISLFILWSILVPIETATVSEGIVSLANNRKTIQHLEGGIIKTIHVKDGSFVKANQLLITLDDTKAQADLQSTQRRIYELLASEARLKSEISEKEQITWPERLNNLQTDSEVASILNEEILLFIENQTLYKKQFAMLINEKEQLENEIKSIQAQVISNDEQAKWIEEEIIAVAYLEKKQLVEKPRLLSLNREKARLYGNKGELEASIERLKQKINEHQQQILAFQAKTQKDNLENLNKVQADLGVLLEKEKAVKDILNRTKIYAPNEGIVMSLQEHTLGGVIMPGKPILEIVPKNDELLIKTKIRPIDINMVNIGLKSKLQFLAFKQRYLPTFYGTVSNVSPDVYFDTNNHSSYYMVDVKITSHSFQELNNMSLNPYPGMPVQVMIITDKKTLIGYLISPIRDSFNRAFKEP